MSIRSKFQIQPLVQVLDLPEEPQSLSNVKDVEKKEEILESLEDEPVNKRKEVLSYAPQTLNTVVPKIHRHREELFPSGGVVSIPQNSKWGRLGIRKLNTHHQCASLESPLFSASSESYAPFSSMNIEDKETCKRLDYSKSIRTNNQGEYVRILEEIDNLTKETNNIRSSRSKLDQNSLIQNLSDITIHSHSDTLQKMKDVLDSHTKEDFLYLGDLVYNVNNQTNNDNSIVLASSDEEEFFDASEQSDEWFDL